MDGNVWYLGEDSKEYEDGEVVSTAGSWEAGVGRAQAGIEQANTGPKASIIIEMAQLLPGYLERLLFDERTATGWMASSQVVLTARPLVWCR